MFRGKISGFLRQATNLKLNPHEDIKDRKIKKKTVFYVVFCLILCFGLFVILFLAYRNGCIQEIEYRPSWNSLQNYEIPAWFKDAKFGIYTHWGVYSVPAKGHNGTWYPHYMYCKGTEQYNYHVEHYGLPSQFGHKDFIPMFKAEKFNAEEWAELFKKSGAQFTGRRNSCVSDFAFLVASILIFIEYLEFDIPDMKKLIILKIYKGG